MRVISQNRKDDFQYENGTVFLSEDLERNTIKIKISGDDAVGILGAYSTREKAIKAMEMMREQYMKYMEVEGHADLTGQGIVQPNFWVLPKVFQFPQDDEIEV